MMLARAASDPVAEKEPNRSAGLRVDNLLLSWPFYKLTKFQEEECDE